MDLTPALIQQLVTLLLGILGGSGFVAAYLKYHADREKQRLEAAEKQEAARIAADTQRAVAETQREVAADQVDLRRGERAIDRILQLERENDRLEHDRLRLVERAVHSEARVLEVARYAAALEDQMGAERSTLVADLLLGTSVPISTILAPESELHVRAIVPPAAPRPPGDPTPPRG